MEGRRLLSGYACGRVRLLELFQMPPRSIRSDERNACRSSPEVADIWLVITKKSRYSLKSAIY